MFEKGDIVECIKDFSDARNCNPPISKGQIFVVNDLCVCQCGASYIDIGLPLLRSPAQSNCPICNKKVNAPLRPFYHTRGFRKIEPEYRTVEISESINKQVKELVYN